MTRENFFIIETDKKDLLFYEKLFSNELEYNMHPLSFHQKNLFLYIFIAKTLNDEKRANKFIYSVYKKYFLVNSLQYISFDKICEKLIYFCILENIPYLDHLIEFIKIVNNYEKYFYLFFLYLPQDQLIILIKKIGLKNLLEKLYFHNKNKVSFFVLIKNYLTRENDFFYECLIEVFVLFLEETNVIKKIEIFSSMTIDNEFFCSIFYKIIKNEIDENILKKYISFVDENDNLKNTYLPKIILIDKIKENSFFYFDFIDSLYSKNFYKERI